MTRIKIFVITIAIFVSIGGGYFVLMDIPACPISYVYSTTDSKCMCPDGYVEDIEERTGENYCKADPHSGKKPIETTERDIILCETIAGYNLCIDWDQLLLKKMFESYL